MSSETTYCKAVYSRRGLTSATRYSSHGGDGATELSLTRHCRDGPLVTMVARLNHTSRPTAPNAGSMRCYFEPIDALSRSLREHYAPVVAGSGARRPRVADGAMPTDLCNVISRLALMSVNLIIEKIRRIGHGYHNFDNYRRRLLLGCGIQWTTVPTHRIRGRHPRPPRRA